MASLFSTRSLLETISEGDFGAKSFLRDRYFSNVKTFNTEMVDFDIVESNGRRLAPFVNPKIGGKAVARVGYKTNSYRAPVIAPETITIAEEFLKRSPGEMYGGSKTPEARAAEAAIADMIMLEDMITRREEVMCSEALFSGKITIKGDGYDDELKYWPESGAPTSTSSTLWNDAGKTASDIEQEIRGLKTTQIKNGGGDSKDMILGSDVLDVFLTKFKDYLDTRKVDFGVIDPKTLPQNVRYWGYLKTAGVDVFSYDEWYKNDEGVEVSMIPSKKVLLGSTSVKTTMGYGSIAITNEDGKSISFYEGRRIPSSYIQRKPSARVISLQAAPLPIVNQVNGFYVLNALT